MISLFLKNTDVKAHLWLKYGSKDLFTTFYWVNLLLLLLRLGTFLKNCIWDMDRNFLDKLLPFNLLRMRCHSHLVYPISQILQLTNLLLRQGIHLAVYELDDQVTRGNMTFRETVANDPYKLLHFPSSFQVILQRCSPQTTYQLRDHNLSQVR